MEIGSRRQDGRSAKWFWRRDRREGDHGRQLRARVGFSDGGAVAERSVGARWRTIIAPARCAMLSVPAIRVTRIAADHFERPVLVPCGAENELRQAADSEEQQNGDPRGKESWHGTSGHRRGW
jgi:hypothetical protein